METIHKTSSEKQALSSFSEKDSKWDHHRANAQSIEAIYGANPDYKRIAARINACSTALGFAWSNPDENGEVKIKLKAVQFCYVRHCTVCAWRKSLRNIARFFTALPVLQEKYPNDKFLFLTLTVKNCEPMQLRETLKSMNAGWQRLIQRKDWPAVGFIRATEVTRNDENGSAHPHFHVLLQVKSSYFKGGNYVSQAEWVKRWQSAMRLDYEPVVDIRSVKTKKEGQTLQAAILETLKYATKPEDALKDPNWLYAITDQLHKLRFLSTGGTLKDIIKEEVSEKEMIAGDETSDETSDENEPELWFGWKRDIKKYIRDK